MKKLLFIICFGFFTTLCLKAQTPAGNNQEIQFNNNGIFGASPYLKWDGTHLQFLDLGSNSAKLYFHSEAGDDSYIFSENWGANKNRLVFHTRDDGDDDYAVFRNRHWSDGEKDVFEVHRTWTMANSNFYVMNGNVGIGTSNPNSPLTIAYNNGTNQLAFKRLSGAETFSMNINNSNQIIFKNHSGGGDYDFQTNIGGFGVASTLFIKGANGNIGIGTTTPDSKLTVKGKIHAQEVKVTISAGADFVFSQDYKLPKLENVEKFIKENKHLPEIASEKEMQKEGLLLAKMNIKLLQKIEELTLYTINQEKEINITKSETTLLKKELQDQKTINESLEKKLNVQDSRLQKIETLLNSVKQ